MSDLLPELLALALICLVAGRAFPALKRAPFLAVLVLCVVSLPLVQLIPLPPSLWAALPGRGEVVATFADAGLPLPWLPVTLRPGETWRAWFALLPGLSVLLATLSLDAPARRNLVALVLTVAFVSIPLGMLQVLGGADSPFNFYAGLAPPPAGAKGFFSNPNHFATLLAISIPLAAALSQDPKRKSGERSALKLAAVAFMIFALLLGLALTGSRSAVGLGCLALMATSFLLLASPLRALFRRRLTWLLAGAAAAATIPIMFGMGLTTILARFGGVAGVADPRWVITRVTWDAMWRYFPVGSGVGSFEAVYQAHEPTKAIVQELVNHAHNDWLEISLETGLAGMVLIVAWLTWLAWSATQVRLGAVARHTQLATSALIGLALISLHALWDYPLRPIALSTVVGLLVGMVQPALAKQPRSEAPASR